MPLVHTNKVCRCCKLQVSGRGGVMALASAGSGSIVTVRNCTHRSNIAGVAGGAYLLLATTATFSHSLFHANQVCGPA